MISKSSLKNSGDYHSKKRRCTMNIPKIAWLTVNRSCNLRCQWCYGTSTGFTSGSDMSYETARSIVLLLKETGVNTLVLIGGEPTLWKDLFKLNDLCNSLSLRTNIVTNTYAFRSEEFWKEYLKHSNTRIEPSLKAFDEQSNLLITKTKDFEGIKTGIQRVTGNFKSQVSIVYSTLVENHLLEMVSAAVDLGASSVRVGVCTPMSVDDKFVAPYTVDYDQMVLEISTNYKKMVDITKGKISFTLNTPLCIWPEDFVQDVIAQNRIGTGCQFQHRSGVVFDTDGTVILCNSMFECPVGKYGVDFTDSKSFLELVNSKKVDDIYRHINSYPSKICIDCELFSRCHGGCPIMWTTHNADEVISKAKWRKPLTGQCTRLPDC
jgi:radical SAM protein with 4Fe4S-binding SPASM domain